ncbi:hypothetical protein [Thiomicrorhabdus xiamenensis]|uniref:Membrane protein involved in the export of O-antigen and teichoic acid n=1 Tax=Thiomicrorhabdus xiamenensis TaxID=2739063 RepID=A0A7D4NS99_9GAMM|nr:hypothetical protein [Thiomicrorhabdus xiamenensis]QKI89777.1 hypothetical protein HQN79_09425 [Thiomicrorhabdus xiamenensis]
MASLYSWLIQFLGLVSLVVLLPLIRSGYGEEVYELWLFVTLIALVGVVFETSLISVVTRFLSYIDKSGKYVDVEGQLNHECYSYNSVFASLVIVYAVVSVVTFITVLFFSFIFGSVFFDKYYYEIIVYSLVSSVLVFSSVFKSSLLSRGMIVFQRRVQFLVNGSRLVVSVFLVYYAFAVVYLVFNYLLFSFIEFLVYYFFSRKCLSFDFYIEPVKDVLKNVYKNFVIKVSLFFSSYSSSLLFVNYAINDFAQFVLTLRVLMVVVSFSQVPLSVGLPDLYKKYIETESFNAYEVKRYFIVTFMLFLFGVFSFYYLGEIVLQFVSYSKEDYFVKDSGLFLLLVVFAFLELLRVTSSQVYEIKNKVLFHWNYVFSTIMILGSQIIVFELSHEGEQTLYLVVLAQVFWMSVWVYWVNPVYLVRDIGRH